MGELLEVACDESGSEGENHVKANTDVFAHASVHLTAEAARDCIHEIRDRVRSPAQEYKANHLLREKHRAVLAWLLGPSGPIHGVAHVHLVDKKFFVVSRVVDLLAGEGMQARTMAVRLYREGPHEFDPVRWQAFLGSANDLMRNGRADDAGQPVAPFFRLVSALRHTGRPGQTDQILEVLQHGRSLAEAFRARILDDPTMLPTLDPLIPSIVQTVIYWSMGGSPVSIIHDEQSALTAARIAQLKELLSDGPGSPIGGRLAGVRLVDSRSDSRVQVADFLAGVARKIASDELNDRGDAELTALLRPYMDSSSIWADNRSWSLLGGG